MNLYPKYMYFYESFQHENVFERFLTYVYFDFQNIYINLTFEVKL